MPRHLFAATAAAVERAWDVLAPLVVTVVAALGGWVLTSYRKRLRRKRHERELLDVLKDFASYELDAARSKDMITATGRIRPITQEEIAQRYGADRQQRADLMRRLRELDGQPEQRRRPQDMFAAVDVQEDEQQ